MEEADDETEAALKRTEEAQRDELSRRQREISELQDVVTARDQAIDGLRDAVANIKRNMQAAIQHHAHEMQQQNIQVHNRYDRASLSGPPA